MCFIKLLILTIICLIYNVSCKRPHIIIFLADDMGPNDVGIHGSSQIPTPNIDALGYNGCIFKKHYTMHICTPSRAALLTGNYPIRSGMQGFPLAAGEPRALPVTMATIAEILLRLGYNTHLVGKWHLGHENRSVLPLGRGFQSHLGYWSGFVGYFDYQIRDQLFNGFDLHKGYKPAFEYKLKYATDVFTDQAKTLIQNHNASNPLFLLMSHLAAHTGKEGVFLETPTPFEAIFEKYLYIDDPFRRLYADIVNRMDTSIGIVVKALAEKGLLEDSILVFMSDNGAPTKGLFANCGSNWPYRGLKNTLFEGGVKNTGMIWSKRLKNRHYVENTLFHIVDWMPTLYAAAGGDISDLGKIDGINHWPLLSQGTPEDTPRRDVLLNIDEKGNYSGIMSSDGRYKLIQGSYLNGIYNDYYGDSGRDSDTPEYNITSVLNSDVNTAISSVDSSSPPLTESIIIDMRKELEIQQSDANRKALNYSLCLFDLWEDPTETTDISASKPEIVKNLTTSLESYRAEMVPQTNKLVDPFSAPALCYGTWFPWKDNVTKCEIK